MTIHQNNIYKFSLRATATLTLVFDDIFNFRHKLPLVHQEAFIIQFISKKHISVLVFLTLSSHESIFFSFLFFCVFFSLCSLLMPIFTERRYFKHSFHFVILGYYESIVVSIVMMITWFYVFRDHASWSTY